MFGFDISSFCAQTGEILQFAGWILTIVKVAIPILIIAFGIFDLGKAVVASKEDEIKTGAKRLMWRAIAGIAIFFIPSIVLWLFSAVNTYTSADSQGFANCRTCILKPWSSDCTKVDMQW